MAWQTVKDSFNQDFYGGRRSEVPWNPRGARHGYKAAFGQFPARAGLLNEMTYGAGELFHGGGFREAGMAAGAGGSVRYGGSIFSASGWREITHQTTVGASATGMHSIGARRSAKGMFSKFIGKALAPALALGFFAHQASTEGIGVATRDAALFGAAFGAAKWGLFKTGAALFNPLTIGAAATVGTVFAGRAALKAGRDYRKKLRQVSFGNSFQDVYGNAGTIRQASIAAIQSSKINGRNALGAEGYLLHQ